MKQTDHDSSVHRCASCGLEFTSDWTDADARRELEIEFPGDARLPDRELATVCNDCYQKILQWAGGSIDSKEAK